MKLCVYDIQGKKTAEEVELNSDVFGVAPSKHLMYQAVKTYLANQRQGNAKTKGRSELAYSTAKLIKQKGTGGARRGDRKSPVMVGGGRVFGPVPRSYYLKMNKKQKVLARKSAFSDKAQEQAIIVVDNLIYDEPKTSKFAGVLRELGVMGKKVLLVVDTYTYQDEDKKIENTTNLLKSARNIKNVSFQTADSVNTYEIMRADYLLIQKDALKTIDRVNG